MKRIFTVLALAATMALGACKEETAANRIYVFSQPGCPHCEPVSYTHLTLPTN